MGLNIFLGFNRDVAYFRCLGVNSITIFGVCVNSDYIGDFGEVNTFNKTGRN